jgi:hypothetical protein
MPFSSAGAIQGVLLNDYDSENDPSLQPFLDAANSLMLRVIACATRKRTPLTSEEKEIITTWLAAHLYAMSDQPYTEKQTLSARGKFQGETKMYLEATKYGQTAVNLDPSGCLVAVSNRVKARIYWMGKPPSEQTDYVDRD